jgi:drug/metabolite transporter (DMT)-like permease
MNRYLILIFAAVSAQGGASLFNKYAALFLNVHGPASTFRNPFLYATVAMLGLQTIAWQTALRHFPLSLAYMLMSLSYPLILLLSFLFFGERITTGNIAGTFIIMTGVIILLRGKK